MSQSAYRKFYWGFFFIMIDFRLQGIDVLPDVIGYVLFATGFGILAASNAHFRDGGRLNTAMIVMSVFSLYERPVPGGGVHVGTLNPLGLLIGLAAMIVGLLVAYHLFMGTRDLAERLANAGIRDEAGLRWCQYLLFHLAILFGYMMVLVPGLALVYVAVMFVASIVLTWAIMTFMTRCGEQLQVS